MSRQLCSALFLSSHLCWGTWLFPWAHPDWILASLVPPNKKKTRIAPGWRDAEWLEMLKLRRLWLFTRVLSRAGWIDCVITDDELAMLNYLRVLLPKCVNKASHWLLWARWSWSKPGWIFLNLSTLNLLWNWVCSCHMPLFTSSSEKLNKPDQNITLFPLFVSIV